MFDKNDIGVLGDEFERGLKAYPGVFTRQEMRALRTAFEMGMVNAFHLIENRVQLKESEKR